MKITCTMCRKVKYIRPHSVKNKETYHCKDRHGEYLRKLYSEGKVKQRGNHLRNLKMFAEIRANNKNILGEL